MPDYHILSTKALEPSLLAEAAALGIGITEQPFIATESFISDEDEQRITQLISEKITAVFTSANAVNAVVDVLASNLIQPPSQWQLCCLSGKTRTALREAGFAEEQIIATATDASTLGEKMAAGKIAEAFFFCGDKRREELPHYLLNAGMALHEIKVYRTLPKPSKAPEADGLFFFSPSAVESFFSLNQLNGDTVCFAIGPTTADSIAAFTNNLVITSKTPDQPSLLAAAHHYFSSLQKAN